MFVNWFWHKLQPTQTSSATTGLNTISHKLLALIFLDKAYHIAKDLGMTTHVGNVLSSDVFYSNYGEKNIELGKWGVKAVEMEAAALYYLAAQHHVDALLS